MAEHMKISLLDPRWREQRDRVMQEKKEQEQVFAEGKRIANGHSICSVWIRYEVKTRKIEGEGGGSFY